MLLFDIANIKPILIITKLFLLKIVKIQIIFFARFVVIVAIVKIIITIVTIITKVTIIIKVGCKVFGKVFIWIFLGYLTKNSVKIFVW